MCIGHQWPPVTVVFHLSWCWLRIIHKVALWSGDHLMTLLYHASNGIGLPGPKKATCSAVHKNPLTLLPAGIKDHPGPHWIENCKNSLEKDKRLPLSELGVIARGKSKRQMSNVFWWISLEEVDMLYLHCAASFSLLRFAQAGGLPPLKAEQAFSCVSSHWFPERRDTKHQEFCEELLRRDKECVPITWNVSK